MIPQHLSLTNEHFTPSNVIEAARATLGEIDLDPASCPEANLHVQACRYFTQEYDGLAHEWSGRVFLNPPGGIVYGEVRKKWDTRSSACAWWRKLVSEIAAGRVPAAVFVGFTLEILRTTQGFGWLSALSFPLCVPAERLPFSGPDPTHANVIVYVGMFPERFRAAFSAIGEVRL